VTSEENNLTGSDVSDVLSGTVGEAIEVWLTACSAKGIQPRLTATASKVTLRCGERAWTREITPEVMKAALVPFKSDARWNTQGTKSAGYSRAGFCLSEATPGYVKRVIATRGTSQTEGNTQTVTLGSVAKAQAFLTKWENALATAQSQVEDARAKLEDAKKNEEVRKLESDKKLEALDAKKLEDATKNREALVARAAKLQKQLAFMQALLDKTAA